jgi:hypothetical protein
MATKPRDSQNGLKWSRNFLGAVPESTREPGIVVIERIARKHFRVNERDMCLVPHFASGAFNKLYHVQCHRSLLLRVSLPVCSRLETQSEVATILLLKAATDIRVPNSVAWDDTNENGFGFEWILIEMVDALHLKQRWRNMTMDVKRDLVKAIARTQAQILNSTSTRFEIIGNVYLPPQESIKFASEEPFNLFSWTTANPYVDWCGSK